MKSIPLILLFFSILSCGDKKEETISEVSVEDQDPIEMADRVETDETLFSNFESQPNMKKWIDFYKANGSELNLSNFNLEASQKLEMTPGNVAGNFDPNFNTTYEPFLIYNPTKTMYLDIDSYKWELDQEGNALFEADQEINLVNLKDKTVSRVAFYGPSFWVEDALWLGDSLFVLLENNHDNQPSIQIFNLKNNRVSPYVYSDSLRQPITTSYAKKRLIDHGIKVQ